MKLIVPIVYDEKGIPVEAALVFTQIDAKTGAFATTDKNGMCAMDNIPDELTDTQFTVAAAGYNAYSVSINLGTGNKQVRVGLQADPARPEDVILPALKSIDSFRPAPSRLDVLKAYSPMQGLRVTSNEFGAYNTFGIETSYLKDDDLVSHCKQVLAAGFTHVNFAVSWKYVERDFSYLSGACADLTNNLSDIRRRMELCIKQGANILCFLACDGLSVKDNSGNYTYNDQQGMTYGYEWGLENVPRILKSLQGDGGKQRDLTKYILFVPGYDGVFYGWGIPNEVPDRQPERVINFGNMFRQTLPNGYLAIEHSIGKIPVGEGGSFWETGNSLDPYDVCLSEFDSNCHEDATWQIVARLGKNYKRPSDQPAGDDPNPPKIFHPCSRGERVYVKFEYRTYDWVRERVSVEDVLKDKAYLDSLSDDLTC